MRVPRLWLAIGLGFAALALLLMLLQLIVQLQWQLSYWLPGWLVGPVLLLIPLALALVVVQLGLPWWRAFRRGPGGSAAPTPAAAPLRNRREAAERHLEAIDQTLERIRDEVEREALREEQQRMQRELERGDLLIVVFGSGSTGKTSLIRALLQELVGEVAAAKGSTTQAQRYRLRLRGLDRGVLLEDTPGILEAGADGRGREEEARRRAARADLLLLVVDGDLRASEMEVLRALASLGKRLMLVLNKCDLRGEQEESRLLQLLRSRCGELMAAEDVVPASASPQSVPLPGGKPWQPRPEVEALLRRIATVLHQDGEELIADNLLLQCRQLGEASRGLLDRQRQAEAEAIVERFCWIGAGVVLVTPLPGVDLLGTAAVQAQMVLEIGRVFGVNLSRGHAQDLALSVGRTMAGLGLVKGGVGLLANALSLSLPALIVGRALQAVSVAWLTRLAGRGFITYFQQNQDWGDGGLHDVLRRQYELDRRDGELRRFLEAALRRVVEPLNRQGLRLPPRGRQRRPGPPAAAAEADPDYRAP